MKISEHKIKLSDIEINYISVGEGLPMVFLTNGGGFWEIWTKQIEHFAKDYKVLSFDWPGCGKSELSKQDFTLDFLYGIFIEFVKEMQLDKFILVGTCVGGAVALKYATANPQKIIKLSIINLCPADRIFPTRIFKNILKNSYPDKKTKNIFAGILRYSINSIFFRHKFPDILFDRDIDKSSYLYRKFSRVLKEKKQSLIRVELMLNAHTYNLKNYLEPDNLPVHLFMWAEHNQVASLEKHGKYYYNILKSQKFIIVKKGGHLCMYESPEEVNNAIEQYISN